MPPVPFARAVLPAVAVALLTAASPGAPSAPGGGAPPSPCAHRPVPPCARAPVPSDSVRQLNVAIVLVTSSFNKTLTAAEIERVHEEVAEFYAFYQQHGAGKVDFRFSLVQIDRRIERREIAEVSPGRYYLARENLAPELEARGFRGSFDEVIALHAWSNANPDRALQAYGGGAVGPDGHFLGDAGFNSIPVMGRDPNTIGQVLVHEVLHNLDDMFGRSGMPDGFLNADEMSRNMAELLRDRPGAFLPRYSDSDMMAFAERERQGREGYPWALQLVYYGWMLERTPKEAWDRLRYGRMVPAGGRPQPAAPVRPLYASIYTSIANDSIYVPVLAPEGGQVLVDGRAAPRRSFAQTDFDGTPVYTGSYFAAWAAAPSGEAGRLDVAARLAGRALPATGPLVYRQRVASVVAEPLIVRYVDGGGAAEGSAGGIPARVLQDRQGGEGPPLSGARLTIGGGADLLSLGTHEVTLGADEPMWFVHQARVELVQRRSWRVSDDGPLTVSLGSPLTINAFVREDRGRDDVAVTATIEGRRVRLERSGDGRYSAVVPGALAPGLHWALVSATAPGGEVVSESLRVYVRPAGWIRPPQSFTRGADGTVPIAAQVQSRMGEPVQGAHLPLVAVVGDAVAPLVETDSSGDYVGSVRAGAAAARVVLASLAGDLQRRVVEIAAEGPAASGAGGAAAGAQRPAQPAAPGVSGAPAPAALPVYAAAVRMERPPAIDADLADWPRTSGRPVALDAGSFLLTDSAVYHGPADLSASIRLGWDDSTLYVAGEIVDDSVTGGDAWDVDRVNLVFDMNDDTTPLTYRSANPPLNEWQDDDYWVFWRFGGTQVRRFGKTNADPVPGARLATRRTAGGWAFEVALPRSALPGYVPFVGQVSGLQAFVTDGDAEPTATELMWTARWPYSADGIEWRLAELALLLFVDAPSP